MIGFMRVSDMKRLPHKLSAVALLCVVLSTAGHTAEGQGFVGKGDWQSLNGEAIRGTWDVDLVQEGADVRGSIALTGSTLFAGGTVTGTIDGQSVVLGVMAEGVKQATFSGKLDGEHIAGEWECPAIKDEGVWTGTLRLQQSGS
jgi:hypothetical protein